MAFSETGTLKLFALFRLARCTKPRQPALNENFNLPYGSHVKKHDTRLVIGRIAFLTCGKSDTRHLIGLHRFANENLLCGFSVCKSQYLISRDLLTQRHIKNQERFIARRFGVIMTPLSIACKRALGGFGPLLLLYSSATDRKVAAASSRRLIKTS